MDNIGSRQTTEGAPRYLEAAIPAAGSPATTLAARPERRAAHADLELSSRAG